jgi:hypothetical protein
LLRLFAALQELNQMSEIALQGNGVSTFKILDNFLAVKARTVRKGTQSGCNLRLHTFVFAHALDYL